MNKTISKNNDYQGKKVEDNMKTKSNNFKIPSNKNIDRKDN